LFTPLVAIPSTPFSAQCWSKLSIKTRLVGQGILSGNKGRFRFPPLFCFFPSPSFFFFMLSTFPSTAFFPRLLFPMFFPAGVFYLPWFIGSSFFFVVYPGDETMRQGQPLAHQAVSWWFSFSLVPPPGLLCHCMLFRTPVFFRYSDAFFSRIFFCFFPSSRGLVFLFIPSPPILPSDFLFGRVLRFKQTVIPPFALRLSRGVPAWIRCRLTHAVLFFFSA